MVSRNARLFDEMLGGRTLNTWRDRKPEGNCAFIFRCLPASYPATL